VGAAARVAEGFAMAGLVAVGAPAAESLQPETIIPIMTHEKMILFIWVIIIK